MANAVARTWHMRRSTTSHAHHVSPHARSELRQRQRHPGPAGECLGVSGHGLVDITACCQACSIVPASVSTVHATPLTTHRQCWQCTSQTPRTCSSPASTSSARGPPLRRRMPACMRPIPRRAGAATTSCNQWRDGVIVRGAREVQGRDGKPNFRPSLDTEAWIREQATHEHGKYPPHQVLLRSWYLHVFDV